MKVSRGRRLTHRKGSIVDLEYQSQGCPASGRKSRPASKNSLGMSEVGLRQPRGIPRREASSHWTLSNETSIPDHVDPAL